MCLLKHLFPWVLSYPLLYLSLLTWSKEISRSQTKGGDETEIIQVFSLAEFRGFALGFFILYFWKLVISIASLVSVNITTLYHVTQLKNLWLIFYCSLSTYSYPAVTNYYWSSKYFSSPLFLYFFEQQSACDSHLSHLSPGPLKWFPNWVFPHHTFQTNLLSACTTLLSG